MNRKENSTPYISIEKLQIQRNIVSWEISKKELNVIVGPNKSGKSLLAKIICGQVYNYKGKVNRTIHTNDISFSDYTASSTHFQYSDFYYQQRYNVSDVADVEMIKDYVGYDAANSYHHDILKKLLPKDVLAKKIIELSSGESRKLQIMKALLKPALIYVLDNPFTGLDQASVTALYELFQMITKQYDKTIILLLNQLPETVTFNSIIELQAPETKSLLDSHRVENLLFNRPKANFDIAFEINGQDIMAGNKLLISHLSWTIRKGEKWLLRGANGSGKTTIMSLLNADNPFAYSLKVKLFDRERGTGESIWEIKSKIGFVSPEIQLFWEGGISVKKTILSGFSNAMVLNRHITEEEEERYKQLLHVLQLQTIEYALFGSLSYGEKGMVMLARALVNNPPLLILDEPFQGLDADTFDFLYDFLSSYIDSDHTVIQIAHLQKEVLPCINRIAQIDKHTLAVVK